MYHLKKINYTECVKPPEASFSSWKVQSSYIGDQLLTDTKIKYTCDADYSLRLDENDERVCGKDGNWDNNTAPKCVPR